MKNCKSKNCKHYKRDELIGVKCCEYGLHESYCEKDKEDFAIEKLEKIKAEIKEWYWQSDKQELAKDPCVVDAMTDLFIRTINNHISELKGE